LRSALHRRGLRFRKNFLVRVDGYRAIRPDIVFTRARVAVFVDGCFWHACSEHGTWPRTNSEFWRLKLERNIERDCQVDQALTAGGWQVVRVWEHEDPNTAASRIKALVTDTPREEDISYGYDSHIMAMTADETLIAEVTRRLAEAAPGARVILFGSRARGEARPDSDLDLLVIEPGEVTKRRAESARLRRELRGLEVALDVIVISAKHADDWGHFEGSMLNEALREGRVLVEA
jgi:DNA mismatch endonuclease, patch repair protein